MKIVTTIIFDDVCGTIDFKKSTRGKIVDFGQWTNSITRRTSIAFWRTWWWLHFNSQYIQFWIETNIWNENDGKIFWLFWKEGDLNSLMPTHSLLKGNLLVMDLKGENSLDITDFWVLFMLSLILVRGIEVAFAGTTSSHEQLESSLLSSWDNQSRISLSMSNSTNNVPELLNW